MVVSTPWEWIVAEFIHLWEGGLGANASALLRTAAPADAVVSIIGAALQRYLTGKPPAQPQ
ncbi:MAG TPA: hypothetical protein VFY84_04710 [Jiangellales bacterium]|nr:hypothetical protein [Jiangellales bacterium]